MSSKETIDTLYKINRKLSLNNRKFSNQSSAMLDAIKQSLILIHDHKCAARNEFEELLAKISGALTLSVTKSINYSKDYTIEDR